MKEDMRNKEELHMKVETEQSLYIQPQPCRDWLVIAHIYNDNTYFKIAGG